MIMMYLFSGVNMASYPSGELMPCKESVPFPCNKDHSKPPTITLREAAVY